MTKYNPKKIEKKWQKFWAEREAYRAEDFAKLPKKYVLVEFPYPSGDRLHMGHLRPYTAADVVARFNRAKGYEVMFPFGWDAFGLPAENYAIKMGVSPEKTTAANIKHAKEQVKAWGMSFDWSREVNTTDPDYYKWTQWIFLQFYKAALAYEAVAPINWCPKDKTGLANEEVVNGKCERCGTSVEKKDMRQWFLRITDYAEKLLDGLKDLEWPEAIKIQQENWIGKSEGAEIEFEIADPRVKRFVILHGRASKPTDHFYPWLKGQLEKSGFEVEVPEMPNPGEPNDLEQAGFVLKNCSLDESTVIVGHSLGGLVAMRLLEQGVKVHGVVLAATPISGKFLDNRDRPSVREAIERGFDFKKINQHADYFKVLVDSSDDVVPGPDGKILAEKLNTFAQSSKGTKSHFCGGQEPAILESLLPFVKVFTTRPDTIFGATYMVLAPEHPLVRSRINLADNRKEIQEYIDKAKRESEIERTSEAKEKTGVELTSLKVINPATKEKIPVWIADYVLASYGTGAIMAVPAHDERDMEFASKFKLPIIEVVDKDGVLINSGEYDGMPAEQAKKRITEKFGTQKVQYKLRDWLFSRQRYWGEPIPIIHCDKCGIVPVPEKDLPVELPKVKKYEPTGTGESPLAAIDSWVNVECPKCGGSAKRETNTMPQWAGSSWYFLRYCDPDNQKEFAASEKLKYWMPIDMYFGGMEHTTLHLLYSRFWNLFLHDQGLVPVAEPYARRIPHGIVLAADGEKMSKSRGNVVNPDDIVEQYGADTMRMYELFLGPHEQAVSWNDQGIVGVFRFLQKVWTWVQENAKNEAQKDSEKVLHEINKLIKNIGENLEELRFNTCVSGLMEFLNNAGGESVSRDTLEKFLLVLSVFAPHISEELWSELGHKQSIAEESWPEFDAVKVEAATVNVVVQVNGKYRGALDLPKDSAQSDVEKLAAEIPTVKAAFGSKEIKKVIFVPNKIINFVV